MGEQASFTDQLIEMYQGEVIGEVLFNAMLAMYPEPDQQYKSATMLQLETETKARLRPALAALGADLTELEASREAGHSFVDALAGKDWSGAMQVLSEGITPYVERYREIAASAPTDYRDVAESMVEHEEVLHQFVTAESAGEGEQALQALVAQLQYPLTK